MRRVFGVVFAALGWTVIVSICWVALLAVADPPVTWHMADQCAELGAVQRAWRDLGSIAPAMPLAVIAAEDQKYMEHHGFDVEAMRQAWERNSKDTKGRLRGGSTISQQVAKNVFLWPGRSLLRKGLEAWFTGLIESIWGKERIMEVYLNVAEMGKGAFGVQAIADRAFQREAIKLSRSQCARIAACLPSPRRYDAAAPSSYVSRRADWVLRQMNNLGDIFPTKEP